MNFLTLHAVYYLYLCYVIENGKSFRIINKSVFLRLLYCNHQAISMCGYHCVVMKKFTHVRYPIGSFKEAYFANVNILI